MAWYTIKQWVRRDIYTHLRRWAMVTYRMRTLRATEAKALNLRECHVMKAVVKRWRERMVRRHMMSAVIGALQGSRARRSWLILRECFGALKRLMYARNVHQRVDRYFSSLRAKEVCAHFLSCWARQVKEEIINEERSALGAAHTLRALASCRAGVDAQGGSPPSHFTPPENWPDPGKRAGGVEAGSGQDGQKVSPNTSSPPPLQARENAGRAASSGGSGHGDGAARARTVKSKLNNYRTLLTSNSRSSSRAQDVPAAGDDEQESLDVEISRILSYRAT